MAQQHPLLAAIDDLDAESSCGCCNAMVCGRGRVEIEADKLLAQRDALLAACEAVLRYSRDGSDRCPLCGMREDCRQGFNQCPMFQIRAAIATAKGDSK